MKRKLLTLLLSPLVVTSIGCKSQDVPDLGPVNVILISGQSNAVGCSHSEYLSTSMGQEAYEKFRDGFDDIKISFDCWTKDGFSTGNYTYYSQNKSKGFVPVKLGQGNGKQTFGPEIGIADYLTDEEGTNWGGKVFIIKYACGASCLKDDWLDKKNSPMYGRFIKYVKSAMSKLSDQGYKPKIKAFCWMQGEGDAYSASYYANYRTNLETFVGNVRQDLLKLSGNKEMAFIDAKINGYGDWSKYGNGWSEVNIRKGQFANSSENNFLIDTIAQGMTSLNEPSGNPDKDHWDSSSEVKLGRLFAQTFEQFLE